MTNDFFERLGLPRRFAIDPAALERAYLSASLAVHPDFHAQAGDGALAASEAASAGVNEAYTVLKDPFRRAEHLLALLGGPTASEVKDIPPAFLMEMIDLREQIEGATADQKKRHESDIRTRQAALFVGIERLFDRAETDPAARLAVRKELNAAKYLVGLLRDLRN